VDNGKLDDLMNIVGELVLSKNVIARLIEKLRNQLGFGDFGIELYKANRNLERKLEELQGSVLEVRMVPIGQIYDKLRRNVRKLARETDKDIAFIAEGGETELDKLIIEDLADPLMHIIRNSIDHGVETRGQRLASGKPEQASIKLRALQRGNHVVIEISDDGAGLDFTRIKRKALDLGMIAPGSEVKEEDLIQFLFVSGFSTAEKVSEISGRGVGLDVVKNNIGALSGAIDLESKAGQGAKVIITLPITLAIIQALVVEVGKETFAIPLNSVSSGLVVKPEEIKTIEGREVIELRERTLPLLRLEKFFSLETGLKVVRDEVYIVTVGIAERRLGLVVDRLLGRQDIVIKSIGEALSGIRGIAGATELGDQRTILVLDVVGLIEEATTRISGRVRVEAHTHVS
jgi:two-component system chemotaxis sensor kinase CheA